MVRPHRGLDNEDRILKSFYARTPLMTKFWGKQGNNKSFSFRQIFPHTITFLLIFTRSKVLHSS